jgi:hypothetical protein
MNKVIIALVLLAFANVISGTPTCQGNFLIEQFKFNKLDDPTPVKDLKYCKSLEASSCCSAEIINSFQTKADELKASLEKAVAARDKFLIDTRRDFIPTIRGTLTRLQQAGKKASEALGQTVTTPGDGAGSTFNLNTDSGLSGGLGAMADSLTTGYDELKKNFLVYQKQRSECVTEMIQLQASAWCLACDPNFQTKGVSFSSVALSTETCTRLTSSCYKFLSLSAAQNVILSLKYMAPLLEAYTVAMEKIAAKKIAEGMSELLKVGLEGASNVKIPTNEVELPTTMPLRCTATSCDFICDTLITKKGILNEKLLAAGGLINTVTSDTGSVRLLLEEDDEEAYEEVRKPKNRMLAGETWAPKADEAGVTVTFSENPGKVDNDAENSSATMIKGAVMCGAALFLTLFI